MRNSLMFVLRMAARETRASWRRLLFFFLCVAVGVAAIIALRSVIQNVRTQLATESKALTGADIVLSSNRAWTPEQRERVDRLVSGTAVRERMAVVETATMIRPESDAVKVAKMVELQGVEAGYPFYGTLALDGITYDHALLRNHGILVRPDVLSQLGVSVGSQVRIGDATFTIRGVIVSEPGRNVGFFSLGPRVLIDLAELESTKLLSFGSRASFRELLRVDDADLPSVEARMRSEFASDVVNIRSSRGRDDRIGEDMARAENYLSLVGFVVVVLGGIGVWSVTRVFVQQKLRSVAVLKCLGASGGQMLAVYLTQMSLLALAGCALGVVMAAVGLRLIPPDAAGGMVASARTVTASAVLQGFAVGALVSVLFALVPLLEVRSVKPLLLLREDAEVYPAAPSTSTSTSTSAPARASRLYASWPSVVVGVGLMAVAAWQAGSMQIGLMLCAGFVVVSAVLHLAGSLLVKAVAPLASAKWFALRHAVLSFNRPGNQTRIVLLAVGLGSFFIVGVHLLQNGLLSELSLRLRDDGPDMFLMDVQRDQLEGVRSALQETGATDAKFLPVLRARVVGVEGREVRLENFQDVRGRGGLAREYTVTYRAATEPNEEVVDGTFWDAAPSATPEVSIEQSIEERFEIHVGDLMRFDVLGRPIEARVTSVRKVDWADSRNGGFMFVFRPGGLDAAPHSYLATLRAPADGARRAAVQRTLVDRFPNVSAIDVREVARTLQSIVANVALAISMVGAVALLSGVLILIGSVAMTKVQRLYESALFKTLGAPTSTIAAMVALEYATLGALAGTVGALSGQVLSWAMSRYVLDIPWTPAWGLVATGIAATGALVGTIGVMASLDVLRRKPLSILRAG